ncbi:MAG: hypothetical protein ACO1NU_08760 [Arcticibacter sp.]
MWKSIGDFLETNSRILDYILLYVSLIASLGIITQLGFGGITAISNYPDLSGDLALTILTRTLAGYMQEFWHISD